MLYCSQSVWATTPYHSPLICGVGYLSGNGPGQPEPQENHEQEKQCITWNMSKLWSLKTKSCHDANFVITGGTAGCHYDNLQCHQLRQSWYYDESVFIVFTNIFCAYIDVYHVTNFDKIPLTFFLIGRTMDIYNHFSKTTETAASIKNILFILSGYIAKWLEYFF